MLTKQPCCFHGLEDDIAEADDLREGRVLSDDAVRSLLDMGWEDVGTGKMPFRCERHLEEP